MARACLEEGRSQGGRVRRGVARACLGRRGEAREGESGGVWPGPVWGGGRKPGRVSQEGCGQRLSGEEGGSQGG